MKIKNFDLKILAEEKSREYEVPGLTAAVIRDGRITESCAVGVRDDAGTPMTEDTLFEAASLTKSLFAVLAMRLVDRGILDLDAPMTEQGAPVWSDDPRIHEITPRQALCHATGLPNWEAQPLPFFFDPGTGYSYSGEGYYLLQHLIEEKLGKGLPEICREEFFRPWQMDTEVIWTPAIGERMSVGFAVDGSVRKRRIAVDNKDLSPEPNAAWSLYANAVLYARFLRHMMKERGGLSEQAFDEMKKIQNDAGEGVGWGLGWGIPKRAPELLWHWGDNRGFKNFSVWDTSDNSGVTIFTNSDRGMACYFAILGELLKEPAWIGDLKAFIEGAE